jgi:UDP:flavonoid glycosyltransferase YjiC (YdhE family)
MIDAPLVLTPQQAAERLGVRLSTLRKHAATLEALMGEPLPRGEHLERLWPESMVDLLSQAMGMVHRHEAASVEGALRALYLPAAPPLPDVPGAGMLTSGEDLPELLREALAPVLAPILAELTSSRAEVAALRLEVEAARGQLARLEVTAHAALPPTTADQQPTGLRGLLVRLLRGG